MSEQKPPEEPKPDKPKEKGRPRPNVWMITTFAILAIFAASLLISDHGITGAAISTVSAQQVAEDTIDFINSELLGGQATAELVNVTEKSGLYLVTFRIEDTMYSTYASKDGKFMFPQVIDVEAYKEASEETVPQIEEPSVTKTDKPTVKFFVMSFCPYGQQAMAGLKPVAELLGDKADFQPHYVIYENYCGYGKPCSAYPEERPNFCLDSDKEIPSYCSMHGIAELNENIRQLCVYNLYPAKFWDYVSHVMDRCSVGDIETCWKDSAQAVGIDIAKIEACQAENGMEYMTAEAALNAEYDVRGSPTIFINDALYSGARSAEAFKSAICDAFSTAPSECETALSGTASAPTGGCAE